MTRPLPILAGNWKMHKGPVATRSFFDEFDRVSPVVSDRSIWFFPPALSVQAALDAAAARPDITIGVQNIHWEAAGAFTGEISAPMAAEAGVRMALIGHSERRHVFGESDAEVGRKVAAALAAGLEVTICVGETLEQRQAGILEVVLERQLGAALESVSPAAVNRVTVAYEPVWAIGTGVNATPDDAAGAHGFVRQSVVARLGTAASTIPVLYGGSVKPGNAADLLAAADVDGLLVGGASLEPGSFAGIVAAAAPGR